MTRKCPVRFGLGGASNRGYIQKIRISININYRLRLVVSLQLLLIVSYTAIITWALPDLWFHPFGPVTKNLPLLVATLILLVLEED